MTIIFIEATGTASADEIVAAVQAGALWGVDMGTTSKSAAYSDRALVECTKTRADALVEACPEDLSVSLFDSAPCSFTSADDGCQVWYLRGKMGQ
jgi:hypothetical protein